MEKTFPTLSNKTDIVAAFCNTPDEKTAQKIAERLISEKAAACINILSAGRSFYVWEGQTQFAEEVPIIIKTTQARVLQAQRIVQENHPDKVPEFIVLPVTEGLPEYLQWVRESCT